ncbi:hypothetical protein TSOC_010220 [Tetrabaena socialis]|uniref:Protein kinase domain-containing protein n=1 Tax=Tetrabaena socialis TaxID=47790 RepID=A0A2J7ZTU6_9CHLO|nr:hypothetical protein TSOC_010220 [Tetrabaena socialis]|eukprot:PNH03684.1 hypothetical protein TSOC_010220 [Tetrabaena socialis]
MAGPPANIPPELVSPVFRRILEAVAEPSQPPPDLSDHSDLYVAVRKLLAVGSGFYPDEAQLQNAFIDWNNTCLQAGALVPSSSSTAEALPNKHVGMYNLICDNKDFLVTMLACKSDVGVGEPLVQALAYYQNHDKEGACWESDSIYRASPLPALVLLLKGPCLSIHAVWTIFQNRVGYAPLTPSYYLANDRRDTANVWKMLAVLAAYKKAVQELVDAYEAQCQVTGTALDRMASLRTAAHITEEEGVGVVVTPCTLPYSLLDEQLGLSNISFRGPDPCLIYTALQRTDGGAERRVLVKFVHTAWHAAGVAPELYRVQPVGGSLLMVVMELLSSEDGWMPLGKVLDGGGGEPLKQAVHEALRKAHAAPVGVSGYKAVHGDIRCPNITVQNLDASAASPKVFIIDYDWAGRNGEATYPLVLLASGPTWHAAVRPGAVMQQEHDVYLLARELGDQQ